MKPRLFPFLGFLVVLTASATAYSFELTAGEGVAAAWNWGLAPDLPSGFVPRGLFIVQIGLPLPVGKLYGTAQAEVASDFGGLVGLGWGGEWFAAPWFSVEAAAVVKAGWFSTWSTREPTQFLYAGVEPLLRANVLLLDGFLVLGLSSSPSVRWLQQTVVVASLPAVASVGLRF